MQANRFFHSAGPECVAGMAPSLLMSKMPMTPHRVMAMVLAVAVLCLVFSALKAPAKSLKLGAVLDQPPAAAVDALHVKVVC